MFPKNSAATIAGVRAGSMFILAATDVQKGEPVSKVDLIPAAQLLNGTAGSTAAIAYHLDMITGSEYRAAPDTKPLPLDGLTDLRADGSTWLDGYRRGSGRKQKGPAVTGPLPTRRGPAIRAAVGPASCGMATLRAAPRKPTPRTRHPFSADAPR
jgi:hypothetical protein